ncbi:MAG: DUF2206 domain-containing protein [Methanobacterium sp.]
MFIDNYIKLNDWPIKKFIWFILTVQLSLLGIIGLDLLGINIPLLREVIGFIYLVYIPGIIILRIFRLHKLSNIETLFYSVSISLATLMFIGLLINFSLPLAGFEGPISFVPLLLSINLVTILLLILSYFFDKEYIQPAFRIEISSKHLLLLLPLFLSLFGSYLINYHDSNLGIIFMILTIAIIILLVGFKKIDKSLYSFIVLIISISLLLQNSLITNYLSGFDIQREYFLAKLVIYNLKWENFPNLISLTDLNSILSITILPSYFYYICNINIVWIFKIVYPLIYALVPLGLFELFKREFNSRIAFFSVTYFIVNYSFFYNMVQLMRQIIAEVFLVAILLLFLDNKMDKRFRSILIITFLLSLTMSHYGTAPIFLAVLVGVFILQYLFNLYERNKIKSKIDTINLNIVLIFFTIVLIWYIYNNNAAVFISILGIFQGMYDSILSSFLSANSTQGLAIIGMKVTFFNTITKYLFLFTQALIVVGILGILFNIGNMKNRFKMKREYFFFAILFLGICILSILVPNFSSQLDTIRMFHIAIIILSPFFVIGFILIIERIGVLISYRGFLKPFNNVSIKEKINILIKSDRSYRKTFNIISIFLIVFLFLNTGLLQVIVNEPYKPTMALSTNNSDPPLFYEKDISSAEWLNKYKDNDSYIYSDTNGFVLLGGFVGPKSLILSYSLDTRTFDYVANNSYIFLKFRTTNGTINIVEDSVNGSREAFIDQNLLNSITKNKNRIYDNTLLIYY